MIQDKIIVLRTYKHAEANLIVHGITPKGIKLKLIAPSALVSKKRFGGGVLQATHFIQISYKPSRSEEGLGTLLEASMIESFEKLRENYDRLQIALYFVKLVDKVSLEGESHSHALFDLLGHGLKLLQTSDRLEMLKVHFELRLLNSQGVLESSDNIKEYLKTPLAHHDQLATNADLGAAMTISRHILNQYIGI